MNCKYFVGVFKLCKVQIYKLPKIYMCIYTVIS